MLCYKKIGAEFAEIPFFFFLTFLRPHLWHVEVSGLGVKLELAAASLRHSHGSTGSESHL